MIDSFIPDSFVLTRNLCVRGAACGGNNLFCGAAQRPRYTFPANRHNTPTRQALPPLPPSPQPHRGRKTATERAMSNYQVRRFDWMGYAPRAGEKFEYQNPALLVHAFSLFVET